MTAEKRFYKYQPIIVNPTNDPNFFKHDVEFQVESSKLIQAKLKQHDDLIKEVLRMILKREPVPEDAKRLSQDSSTHFIGYDNDLVSEYNLYYDSVLIGQIKTFVTKTVFEPSERWK